MARPAWTVVCLVAVSLSWPGRALPQTVSPEALAAAKEFMAVTKMADQMKQMLTILTQQFKPMSIQNNPAAAEIYDSIAPIAMNAINPYVDAYVNEGAQIYARHFTADEIRQLTNFYQTPTGEKLLQKQPELTRELGLFLQKISPAITEEIKKSVAEEFRKRGQKP